MSAPELKGMDRSALARRLPAARRRAAEAWERAGRLPNRENVERAEDLDLGLKRMEGRYEELKGARA